MRTLSRALGTCVFFSVLLALAGCMASPEEIGSSENALCSPVDTIDSVPDGKDEDCDGKVDEDVDYRKINCPLGTKIIQGTRGNDTITGTSGADCILGYGGNDTINAGGGSDTVFGGPGNDVINTGTGLTDTVKAGKGADKVDASKSTLATVYGEDGADNLRGSAGSDTLNGGKGNDIVVGGGGSDIINGGDCSDLLLGDTGIDTGSGGGGTDTCALELPTFCEKKTSQKVDCATNADCTSTEVCASNVQFCVPASQASCNECTATGTDNNCDGADNDCDGSVDEGFVSAATSCGVGACASTGSTSCVAGSVVNSCAAGTPAANDASCDGIDNDCSGQADEDYVATATSCGSGACAATGSLECEDGGAVDTCEVTCEGACSDESDDDQDGLIDCEDADCDSAPECASAPASDIGKSCTSNADCASLGPSGTCELGFPGGYCYTPCSTDAECPSDAVCWLGASCVTPCGAGNSCENPDQICDGLQALGLPPDPFCRPSCNLSCPSPFTCDPVSSVCQ
jgi:RTX calcium-binding nonapeptide repeat (4 copies)